MFKANSSKTLDEVRKLEQLQAENPKRRSELEGRVQELRRKRGDLIAAAATGDSAATTQLDKIDAEVVAALREKARAEEAAVELVHALKLKRLQALRELAEQYLKSVDAVEATLRTAIRGLAKAVEDACGKQTFQQMDKLAFGGGSGLRAPFGEIGRTLEAALTEALQEAIGSCFTGGGGHVSLDKCRVLLQGLLEDASGIFVTLDEPGMSAIAEAEKRVLADRQHDRNVKVYERSRLDQFLAATAEPSAQA